MSHKVVQKEIVCSEFGEGNSTNELASLPSCATIWLTLYILSILLSQCNTFRLLGIQGGLKL